ncbi:MAG: IclR family transcriptional regulator, partial [Geminicoccales bacterium]
PGAGAEAGGEAGGAPCAKTSYSIQSLVLGLRVLEALIQSGHGKGVLELARELGTTKWRIFRHLHTLCHEGYVAQDEETDKFRVGGRVYALIEALPARFGFVREAREEMVRLRRQRGHTVVIAAPLEDQGVIVIDHEVGTHPVQFVLKIGAIFDFHASAHGKVMLAFSPPALLEQVIARGLPRHTQWTITDSDRLRAEVARVREQGWAAAPEESFPGVNTLVAPILSAGGKLEGSIGIFGSVETIGRRLHREDIEQVVEAGRRISHRLGWQ